MRSERVLSESEMKELISATWIPTVQSQFRALCGDCGYENWKTDGETVWCGTCHWNAPVHALNNLNA